MGGQGKTEATPQELKEQGNQAYKDGDWDKALEKYTQVSRERERKKGTVVFE